MNQYQHIRFEWGGRGPDRYDCIGLADLVRRQHRQAPIDLSKLDWVYRKHPSLDNSPLDLVFQVAQVMGRPIEQPENFSIAILENLDGRSNVGTVVEDSIVAFMGDRVRVVPIDRLLSKMAGIRYYHLAQILLESVSTSTHQPQP